MTRLVKIEIKVIIAEKTERTGFTRTTFKKGISPLSPITQTEIQAIHITSERETTKETRTFSFEDNFPHESVITIEERRQFIPT